MKDILCNELTLLKILLETGHLLPEFGITFTFGGHTLPNCNSTCGPDGWALHVFKTCTVDLPTLNPEALTNWGIFYLSNDTS